MSKLWYVYSFAPERIFLVRIFNAESLRLSPTCSECPRAIDRFQSVSLLGHTLIFRKNQATNLVKNTIYAFSRKACNLHENPTSCKDIVVDTKVLAEEILNIFFTKGNTDSEALTCSHLLNICSEE